MPIKAVKVCRTLFPPLRLEFLQIYGVGEEAPKDQLMYCFAAKGTQAALQNTLLHWGIPSIQKAPPDNSELN